MPRIEEKNGKTKVVFYERELRQFNETDRLIRLSIKMADVGTPLAKAASAALNALEAYRTEIRHTADPATPLLDKLASKPADEAEQPASEPPTGDRVTAGPESPTSQPEAGSSDSGASAGESSPPEAGSSSDQSAETPGETKRREGRRPRKQPV